jgi:hypothetical protein
MTFAEINPKIDQMPTKQLVLTCARPHKPAPICQNCCRRIDNLYCLEKQVVVNDPESQRQLRVAWPLFDSVQKR